MSLRLRADAAVLAGTQHEIRVGKKADDLQRAGVGIDLPVGEEEFPCFGINRAVGKNQLQWKIFIRISANR